MKNSIPMGSLSGIYEKNIGLQTSSIDTSGLDGLGINSSMFSGGYGGFGAGNQEKPKKIEPTTTYLKNIEKKYSNQPNYNQKNNLSYSHNQSQHFPIGQRIPVEEQDGRVHQNFVIKNTNDEVPQVFKNYDNQRQEFRKSHPRNQPVPKGSPPRNYQPVSGHLQQRNEHTNYGRNQQSNSFQQNNMSQNYNNYNHNNNINQNPQININGNNSQHNNNNIQHNNVLRSSQKNTNNNNNLQDQYPPQPSSQNIQMQQQQQYNTPYQEQQLQQNPQKIQSMPRQQNPSNNQSFSNNNLPVNNSYMQNRSNMSYQSNTEEQRKKKFWTLCAGFIAHLPEEKYMEAPSIQELYNMANQQQIEEHNWEQFLSNYFEL